MTEVPDVLLGRYEQDTVSIPRWVIPVLIFVSSVTIVLSAIQQQAWPRVVFSVVLRVGTVVMLLFVKRQEPPVTTITAAGVRVVVPGQGEQEVAWQQVSGIRLFTRAVAPQLLLADGSARSLPGVPDGVARALASSLPGVLRRSIRYEVDGRAAAPSPLPA